MASSWSMTRTFQKPLTLSKVALLPTDHVLAGYSHGPFQYYKVWMAGLQRILGQPHPLPPIPILPHSHRVYKERSIDGGGVTLTDAGEQREGRREF